MKYNKLLTPLGLSIVLAFSASPFYIGAVAAQDELSIQISPELAQAKIDFWARQMSEHALFLHLGLVDPELKERALALHERWEDFRNNYTIETANDIFPLLADLEDLKLDVIERLTAGEWVGWLWRRFVQHIRLELMYFRDKLLGRQFTVDEEVSFWNIISRDHAGFTSKLLDPTEKALMQKADAMAQKFDKLIKSERDMMVQLSLRATKELNKFNEKALAAPPGAIQSIIHPVLLEHVKREEDEAIRTLSQFDTPEARQFVRAVKREVKEPRRLVPVQRACPCP